ncbi:hypothetical protein RF11_10413 [Thelohanellus kitauei]|uniref:FLYWCH-type domain-containing protein n=1 Tax=Thelohanellus kitauei TaxID=669202 RepID=A0A0C2NFK9_THEKT|nr:hypothetical protein RF11_10413 [Thelohanellus kitauei]
MAKERGNTVIYIAETLKICRKAVANRTSIYLKFERWNYRTDLRGITTWRCCKREQDVCRSTLRTNGDRVASQDLGHTHFDNGSQALARRAIGQMKEHTSGEIATPSSVQASLMVTLDDHVHIPLPKRLNIKLILEALTKFITDIKLFDFSAFTTRPYIQYTRSIQIFYSFRLWSRQ